jgi:hypothetical protein
MEERKPDIPVIFLPAIEEIIDVKDPNSPTDAEDAEYNAWCTEKIQKLLKGMAESGVTVAITQYPADIFTGERDSRDRVKLDENGNVVVLEAEE